MEILKQHYFNPDQEYYIDYPCNMYIRTEPYSENMFWIQATHESNLKYMVSLSSTTVF